MTTIMITKEFLEYLSSLGPLSDNCINSISEVTRTETYTGNQVILSEGQVGNRLWWIETGFAMEYVYKDGLLKPYHFWKEKQLLLNVSGFFRRMPSESYFEMLEPGNLLSIHYEHMQHLQHQYPEMHLVTRSLIQHYQAMAEKKTIEMLTLSPEQRYRQLLGEHPFILQKTSLRNIAAYLGVSLKTLGRIRSKER